MSSSVEQESRVDSQVARALEAAKNPFLREIAERFQREPNQILKLSEILGFTTEEEKNAKALVWLKKHEPEKYQAVLQSSEAENKIQEEKEMEVMWGVSHYTTLAMQKDKQLFDKIAVALGFPTTYHEAFTTVQKIAIRYVGGGNYSEIHIRECKHQVLNSDREFCIKLDPDGDKSFCKVDWSGDRKRKKPKTAWNDVYVYVYDEKFLPLARKLARVYEKITRRNGPTKATVLREY